MNNTKVLLTKTGKPDGRANSSKKNASKAREVVKNALRKTFHPNEAVSSSEESDTDDETYDAIPLNSKKQVEDDYPESIVEKDLKKSKKKADFSWETKLQDELKKQEEVWNNRMKQNEDLYQQKIKETEDKYIKAKFGTMNNMRKNMILKF
jgi:hypothetical protein